MSTRPVSTSGLRGWTNTLSTNSRRLAVVGDPIAHSKSPQLHKAAYEALGLEWDYERVLVPEGTLSTHLGSLDESWRGLSVTMPLKSEAFALATRHDVASTLSGVSNTLLLDGEEIRGFNTDVAGLINPLRRLYVEVGQATAGSAVVVGSGATARSAVIALAQLGITEITVVARSQERAAGILELCESLSVRSSFTDINEHYEIKGSALTVSTLPGAARVGFEFGVHEGDVLFDIAYDVWPSANAERWTQSGGIAISGLSMLAAQALE